MSKIIGYNKKTKKYYKAECPKCNAIIIFEDVNVWEGTQGMLYAYCPGCNATVTFNPGNALLDNEDPIVREYQKTENQQFFIDGEMDWPNLTNCRHNCKICQGKCLYRKEDYNPEMV